MKLTEQQLEQIRTQVARLKKVENGFYAKKLKDINPEDIKTQADFEKLPFSSKQELREAYPLGLAAVPEEEIELNTELV